MDNQQNTVQANNDNPQETTQADNENQQETAQAGNENQQEEQVEVVNQEDNEIEQAGETEDDNEQEEEEDDEEAVSESSDDLKSLEENEMPGCKHYKRKCQLLAPCCDKYYTCRLCHDEAFEYNKGCQVERMDRHAVKQIKCLLCKKEQKPQKECEGCAKPLGHYTCLVCNFFDDTKEKQISHCDKCGICRMGLLESRKHCDKCNTCFNIHGFEGHYCKSEKDDVCGICMEDFFYNRKPMTRFGQCKHPIHSSCLKQLLKNKVYNCPICGRAWGKENEAFIEQIDKLIEETKDNFKFEGKFLYFDILCMNCMGKTPQVQFHPYGMKCGDCGSYNTKQA